MRAPRFATFLCLAVMAGILLAWYGGHTPPASKEIVISGMVRDERGAVAGARVRMQRTPDNTLTDAQGRFQLTATAQPDSRITAWKEGYFIGGTPADAAPLIIHLRPLPPNDCADYAWVSSDPDATRPLNCGNCHEEIHREWSASGHARSVSNRHFVNLYEGSDWQGHGNAGWSLLAEHPDGSGVCTSCHAPGLGFDDPAYYDLRKAAGVARQGVHCDYCHKIADVEKVQFGLTHGRFALKLLRPEKGQLAFGPLDDVDRGEDAYVPIYRDSRYCASCHEGIVFGVPVYSTYSEWLESPAARQGKQCQTCHMAATGTLSNVARGHGGLSRDPQSLGNHRFFAGSRLEMLQRCLKIAIRGEANSNITSVSVAITPEDVGHRVPTGFVDRHLLLVVEALSKNGDRLSPLGKTPLLPQLAGKGLSGIPGFVYAKQTSDVDGRSPVPFWRARPEVRDTRLAPGIVAQTSYQFSSGADHLRVRLLYRRFWQEVAETKRWPDNEAVVLDKTFPLSPGKPLEWSR
ncbi:MAG TPA: multiheme c-type cytochrome [Gemmataceae bacterium]|jgi:hypothetical protein|nr:multiheme c-type cytochrome [Gemmataceae bacterium]